MPTNVFLLALAAGIISAIVFASATTGAMLLRVVLFLLTPLSLYLAGLGLGHGRDRDRRHHRDDDSIADRQPAGGRGLRDQHGASGASSARASPCSAGTQTASANGTRSGASLPSPRFLPACLRSWRSF